MHILGKLDKQVYSCITNDIVTDEVILTDERISHIKEKHAEDFEKYSKYISDCITTPDYILEDTRPNTALVLKEITDEDNIKLRLALRLVTSIDDPNYKNSIITFLKTRDSEWNRLLRNKTILYKKE